MSSGVTSTRSGSRSAAWPAANARGSWRPRCQLLTVICEAPMAAPIAAWLIAPRCSTANAKRAAARESRGATSR